MDIDIHPLLEEMPKGIREQISRYAAWLTDNVDDILSEISEEELNREEFISVAVTKKVFDVANRQLETILKSLENLAIHEIYTIKVRGELLSRRSKSVLELQILVSDLWNSFEKTGYSYVPKSTGLKSLALGMVKYRNGI